LCCSAENSVLAHGSLTLSPYVERLPADPVVTARLGDVARDLLGMTDHLRRCFACLSSSCSTRATSPQLMAKWAVMKRPQVSSITISFRKCQGGGRPATA
jgi:hypothetical protein